MEMCQLGQAIRNNHKSLQLNTTDFYFLLTPYIHCESSGALFYSHSRTQADRGSTISSCTIWNTWPLYFLWQEKRTLKGLSSAIKCFGLITFWLEIATSWAHLILRVKELKCPHGPRSREVGRSEHCNSILQEKELASHPTPGSSLLPVFLPGITDLPHGQHYVWGWWELLL